MQDVDLPVPASVEERIGGDEDTKSKASSRSSMYDDEDDDEEDEQSSIDDDDIYRYMRMIPRDMRPHAKYVAFLREKFEDRLAAAKHLQRAAGRLNNPSGEAGGDQLVAAPRNTVVDGNDHINAGWPSGSTSSLPIPMTASPVLNEQQVLQAHAKHQQHNPAGGTNAYAAGGAENAATSCSQAHLFPPDADIDGFMDEDAVRRYVSKVFTFADQRGLRCLLTKNYFAEEKNEASSTAEESDDDDETDDDADDAGDGGPPNGADRQSEAGGTEGRESRVAEQRLTTGGNGTDDDQVGGAVGVKVGASKIPEGAADGAEAQVVAEDGRLPPARATEGSQVSASQRRKNSGASLASVSSSNGSKSKLAGITAPYAGRGVAASPWGDVGPPRRRSSGGRGSRRNSNSSISQKNRGKQGSDIGGSAPSVPAMSSLLRSGGDANFSTGDPKKRIMRKVGADSPPKPRNLFSDGDEIKASAVPVTTSGKSGQLDPGDESVVDVQTESKTLDTPVFLPPTSGIGEILSPSIAGTPLVMAASSLQQRGSAGQQRGLIDPDSPSIAEPGDPKSKIPAAGEHNATPPSSTRNDCTSTKIRRRRCTRPTTAKIGEAEEEQDFFSDADESPVQSESSSLFSSPRLSATGRSCSERTTSTSSSSRNRCETEPIELVVPVGDLCATPTIADLESQFLRERGPRRKRRRVHEGRKTNRMDLDGVELVVERDDRRTGPLVGEDYCSSTTPASFSFLSSDGRSRSTSSGPVVHVFKEGSHRKIFTRHAKKTKKDATQQKQPSSDSEVPKRWDYGVEKLSDNRCATFANLGLILTERNTRAGKRFGDEDVIKKLDELKHIAKDLSSLDWLNQRTSVYSYFREENSTASGAKATNITSSSTALGGGASANSSNSDNSAGTSGANNGVRASSCASAREGSKTALGPTSTSGDGDAAERIFLPDWFSIDPDCVPEHLKPLHREEALLRSSFTLRQEEALAVLDKVTYLEWKIQELRCAELIHQKSLANRLEDFYCNLDTPKDGGASSVRD
ncbi:unnamed protein product [Amoebophrya sp. A25]|nr:unnamed protein product [Amoebophrya sp. A25]|eukprot:GSA25T00000911001.1